ncbi:MAG: ATP-binding protein [Clostridia bacterium]|nr:ATP-binding protein [Clostridia bacterium]
MLLEFRTSNYKSFQEEVVFSMMPAPRQTGLDYSIQTVKIGNRNYRGLSSAVIYGPNASGKTNLIGAMDTMRSIVLRGNVKNSAEVVSPNAASYSLELIPNCRNGHVPTVFSVSFVDGGKVINYSFSVDLGKFMEKDYERNIVSENLSVNGKALFRREGQTLQIIPSAQFFGSAISRKNMDVAIGIGENSLNREELFLCNGFKTIFSKEIVSDILDWFENRFMVIYRSDAMKVIRKFADPKEDTIYISKTVNEAARSFGITSNALGYKQEGDDVVLCSLFEGENGVTAIPAEMFESFGTIRFVNEFPLVIRALLTGATLVMDEFDASIHPMALMNIINIFHNDDINKKGAQLIFCTHNPIFLNAALFRRDEIKFVERNKETDGSIHYALSDFKTSDGIRKGEDYLTNYFAGRYGAIEDVDFAQLMEKILSSVGGEGNG